MYALNILGITKDVRYSILRIMRVLQFKECIK